jgi:hypothetical protein
MSCTVHRIFGSSGHRASFLKGIIYPNFGRTSGKCKLLQIFYSGLTSLTLLRASNVLR